MDKKKTQKTFTITCYGRTEEFPESQRKKWMDFYKTAWSECEGCEAERYANVFFDLYDGMTACRDEKF